MRDLENDLVKLIGSQISVPENIVIGSLGAQRIATWAIKTGLLLEIWTSAMGQWFLCAS
jgi:hypothetical protein